MKKDERKKSEEMTMSRKQRRMGWGENGGEGDERKVRVAGGEGAEGEEGEEGEEG